MMAQRHWIAAAALLALSGCGSVARYEPPTLSAPPAYVTDFRPSAGAGDSWWKGFNDSELDALIVRALDDNLEIAASRSRFEAARALVTAERSDRLPSVDGFGEAGGAFGTDGKSDTSVLGGASIFFDPDISGRLSLEAEAASANAAASEYLVADTRRIIAASVARQYIELRRSEARLALLEQSTALQERTLQIVQYRFEAGLSANLDVRRAAADLAQTRAQRGLLELARARAWRTLSVLTGQAPVPLPEKQEYDAAVPQYSGGPPTGVPADLLRRRPDLLVAEARLAEAAAQVGIERADLLPSLAIPGQISVGDVIGGGFLGNFLATVNATVNSPIFDGGRRRVEIMAAESEAEARFLDYRQSLLGVLAEVENALVAIRSYQERNLELANAIEQSEKAYGQSNALYREGLTSLFDVLDSQRQLINSRQSLIDSEAELAFSIIGLHSAIGSSNS